MNAGSVEYIENMPPASIARPPAVATDGAVLMQIIERAANAPDFHIDRLQQLLDLKERWDKVEGVKAFTIAMTEFKKEPPVILKNKHVSFRNKAGGLTEYDHATHSEVVEKITTGLALQGLSHRWKISQEPNKITVVCIITHAKGHTEETAMFAPPDETGNKSAVQAIASTSTLLQRYTLLAATGSSSKDLPDADDKTDGARPELPVDVWTSLNLGAQQGSGALASAFKELAETTRAQIVLHYATEWANLKTQAAGVVK